MERKNHNRTPVKLSVAVHDKMYRSWDFSIDGFGFDGLRLTWKSKAIMPKSLKVDDLLNVKFSITPEGEIKPKKSLIDYNLEVKVVRVFDNGLAVTFFNPALDAIAGLSKKQLSNGMHENASLINTLNKRSHNILKRIQASFLKSMSHVIDVLLPIVHDVLFNQAEISSNNADQAIYFDAINTLNKSQDNLKNEFISLLDKQISSCAAKKALVEQKENGIEELELIDQYEFENWLTVNQLIIHISPNYEQELLEIELRLAHLIGVEPNQIMQNPFSPETIFNAFSEAIHKYFLNNDILLILYRQFETVVDNNLFEVYKQLNQIFIDENILPLIEETELKIIKKPSDIKLDKEEQKQLSSNIQNHSPQSLNSHASMAHLREINTIQNDVNLVHTYQTLKEIISFQSGHGLEKISEDFFETKEYKTQHNNLVQELSLVQYKQAKEITENGLGFTDIESLVSECINKDCYSDELKNEFNYTLDIIKRLFVSINADDWLAPPVKKLLSVLQVPLLKVSLLHKNFFESWDNPARILINKLALVNLEDEKNSFYLKAHSFVLLILKNYDTNLAIFTKVQKALTELLEIQSEHYKKNVNHVVSQWNAQQTAINEIAMRLAGKSTSIVIADFISNQWLTILVSTYLKYGKDSTQWVQYIQALDMLILSMGDDVSEDFIDKDVILFVIKQGLEENNLYNKNTFDNIKSLLGKNELGQDILLDRGSIFKLLINGYGLSDKTALAHMSQGVTDATTLANKGIAKRLNVNDYITFKQENHSTRLQFIWGSDSHDIFVFSTRTGKQHSVFNLSEVVNMLDSGLLAPTRDYDLPLLERSLYAILGDAHDNLAHENTLDVPTGLINRREFLRLMNLNFNNKQQKNTKFTIIHVDIDQFSLINDSCSYEAGDRYIVEIAREISKALPSNILCAKYDIDQFILKIPDNSDGKTTDISELLRKLINSYRFKWKEKQFTMSASIGQVAVNYDIDVSVFINAVVTATDIAKETGRNRVHVIEHDAVELDYRQELQVWATKVEQIVQNNLLDIRCQRLHPISKNSNSPHYEMLLLVKDGNDYKPPAEFIEAAELYNKMSEVDRWVIRTIFDWFSQHLDQLEAMGGIAINLSGQSLNDVDFHTFIMGVFEQYPEIPHDRVCFEITETTAVTNVNHANHIIHSIKELGCEFALDDFGTGQSSYAYLKNFPVDYLKIDGFFIKDIVNNAADRAMVKSINEIGHFLGMKTVAEYVENSEIVEVLKEIGVDYAQGFGVEKPILMTQCNEFMKQKETASIS